MNESKRQKIDRIMALLDKPQQERIVFVISEGIIGSNEPARVADVIDWGTPPLTLEEKRQYFPTEEEWQAYFETIEKRTSNIPIEG